MASLWIKIEHIMPDKPEVVEIADILDLTPDDVVGKLIRLFIWVDTQIDEKTNAAGVSKKAIDRAVGVIGFADSLLNPLVNWLKEKRNSKVSFVNFERHNGKNAKKRAQTATRVANHNERKDNPNSVSQALAYREEEEEEDKRRGNTKSKPKNGDDGQVDEKEVEEKDLPTDVIIERLTYPPGFDTPDVRKAMTEWYTHRRTLKRARKLTKPIANLNKILRDMASPDDLIRGVENSILENYTGCFPDKKASGGNGQTAPTIQDDVAAMLDGYAADRKAAEVNETNETGGE